MELTQLRQFVAIAGAGHMTRAAEALGVTQPALSAMIKKLEGEIGADLLHRTGRGVELTEAGAVFRDHAREAIRRADAGVQAVRELVGLERGSIRLGGGPTAITYLLPPVVCAFHRQHPDLRFYIREAGSAAAAGLVLTGELDLAVVTLPITLPQGMAGAGDLLAVPLVNDELRLIVPPAHPLAGRRTFRWKDLAGVPVIGFEAGSAVRSVIDQACAERGVNLNVVMELLSIESIRRMVEAGIGVAFVSRFALPPGGGLACKDGRILRDLAIARRRDRVPSPAAAAFERALVAALRGEGARAREPGF